MMENSDNEHLNAIGDKFLIIRFVEEVNGPSAQEVPEYLPTKHGLLLLAEHWAKEAIGIEKYEWLSQQFGSLNYKLRVFAGRRLDRIGQLICQDEVKEVVERVYSTAQQNLPNTLWDAFRRGLDLEVVIFIDLQNADEYKSRAIACSCLYQSQNAINDYTEVIKIDPYDADAFRGRANEYDRLGHPERAIEDRDWALGIDPA